jgi:Arc/MetJ family transcription regulator
LTCNGAEELDMKPANLAIDEALVTEGLKMTGLGSMESLVDYALRELLGREQVRCHCRFAEDPLCRFRWTHPEVAGVCRSGHEKSGEKPSPTTPSKA